MSNEEFERYKEFIVEQQAQSAVKTGQIESTLARLAENTATLAEARLGRFEDTHKRIGDVAKGFRHWLIFRCARKRT